MDSGIFALVLVAACGHAGWNFVARSVSGNFSVFWLGICFSVIAGSPVVLGLCLLYPIVTGPYATAAWLLAATGVLHAAYFFALAIAYRHGEISVVYPVARGSGVGLTAFLAWWILGEQPTSLGTVGILLVFSGIVFMALPALRNQHGLRTLLAAIAVGITIPLYSVVDKVGVSLVHPLVYVWLMYVISAVVLWPVILQRNTAEIWQTARSHRAQIAIIGLGGMLTYVAILYAYQLGPVAYIVATRESSVVVGAMLGFFFLKEQMTLPKILAIAAIVVGLACIKAA